MANSDKNIVITPNIGSASDPTIVFTGANSSVLKPITLTVTPTSNGSLLFSTSAGQVFAITGETTGSIWSVSDVSGVPIVDVDANGLVEITGTFSAAKSHIRSQTLSDSSGTINWDTSLGAVASVTLTSTGRTMAAPTNLKVGTYILHVVQDGTGSRTITTWNSIFKWPAAVAPVLTTTASSRDIFSFICDGTNLYGTYVPDVR